MELGQDVCAVADGGVSGDEAWFRLPEHWLCLPRGRLRCKLLYLPISFRRSHLLVLRFQPTRCHVLQFIYFSKTLSMFQTDLSSIIRSSKLHMQHPVFVKLHFCKTLYMFQTDFPSIIRSLNPHMQRPVFARTYKCKITPSGLFRFETNSEIE